MDCWRWPMKPGVPLAGERYGAVPGLRYAWAEAIGTGGGGYRSGGRGEAGPRSAAFPGASGRCVGIYVSGALVRSRLRSCWRWDEIRGSLPGGPQFAEGHPHLFPEPRLKTAYKLATNRSVHAAIDVSDGLLLHDRPGAYLRRVGRVAAVLDGAAISGPCAGSARGEGRMGAFRAGTGAAWRRRL